MISSSSKRSSSERPATASDHLEKYPDRSRTLEQSSLLEAMAEFGTERTARLGPTLGGFTIRGCDSRV
jgi:hypothetical protein